MQTSQYGVGDHPLGGSRVAAIGNFDGLHLGHQKVVATARVSASALGAPLAVVAFEPSPRKFFTPEATEDRIATPFRRTCDLANLGVDELVLLRFDAGMAKLTPSEFASSVLAEGLGCVSVSTGFDFRFGVNRTGDVQSLSNFANEFGFKFSMAPRVNLPGSAEKVSSTRIRSLIRAGDMDAVSRHLGRWWCVDGRVESGERRGRTLGFPTANFRLGDLVSPAHGIYACWARIDEEAAWRPAVANYGRTPTTGLRDPLLETFLLEFSGDLYGRRLHVAFVERLRAEEHFQSLDALVAQMEQDARDARDILARSPKPAGL